MTLAWRLEAGWAAPAFPKCQMCDTTLYVCDWRCLTCTTHQNTSSSIQRELDKLEDRANRYLLKLSKEKCKVPHLRGITPMYQYWLATGWMRSSFAGKRHLRCMLGWIQANSAFLLWIRQPAYQAMLRLALLGTSEAAPGTLSNFGVPNLRRRLRNWSAIKGCSGHQGSRAHKVAGEVEAAELV